MQNEITINFSTLLRAIKTFWIVVLICTLLGGLLGLGYTYFFKSNVYVGSASFWVEPDSQSSTVGASQMATNYMELCEQDILLRRAVKDAALDEKWNCTEDDAVAYLRSVTGASKSNSESCIFSLNVKSNNQKLTYEAIYALQYTMVEIVDDLSSEYSGCSVTLVGEVLTESDISLIRPKYARNVALTILASLFLSFAVCVMVQVKRDEKSIKNCEVENEE